MAVKYLAGERLVGTTAERAALTIINYTAIPQTSWKQLSKTTLGSAGDTIDSGTITAKDNLMVLIHEIGSGSITGFLQFNSDTGSNYSERTSENGASDGTATSQTKIRVDRGNTENFIVCKIRNNTSQEKLVISECAGLGSAGSGTAPERWETVGKWANTSNQITSIQVQNASGGSFDTGSEMVVLGCDDDEADSGTNFWEELANPTDLATAGDTLDSGTFTAKKYLMVDVHRIRSGAVNSRIQVNGDTGSNYAHRNMGASNSYGSDATTTSSTSIHSHALTSYDSFTTYLIANKASKEKLMIIHEINRDNVDGNATPERTEAVAKWANTSDAITSINVINTDTGNLNVGTSIRVWGGTAT